jgi:hypothetical protein
MTEHPWKSGSDAEKQKSALTATAGSTEQRPGARRAGPRGCSNPEIRKERSLVAEVQRPCPGQPSQGPETGTGVSASNTWTGVQQSFNQSRAVTRTSATRWLFCRRSVEGPRNDPLGSGQPPEPLQATLG